MVLTVFIGTSMLMQIICGCCERDFSEAADTMLAALLTHQCRGKAS